MRRMHAANASVARHPLARRRGTAVAWITVTAAACGVLWWRTDAVADRAQTSRVPILMYHHVGDWGAPGDWAPWVVKPADFEAQMDWLRNHHYHPITMRQLQAHRERGEPLPPRPVMITFDDGWGEDMWIARQYLDPRAMPTVFFVYTGAVGAPGFLSWSDVRALEAGGHEVLSHTVSHPNLQQVPDARLASEMRDSRARLEQELGHPVECIAYPFGSYDGRVVKAAADAGYRLAVIADGPGAMDASPALELPRWKMAYGEPLPLFVQRLRAP